MSREKASRGLRKKDSLQSTRKTVCCSWSFTRNPVCFKLRASSCKTTERIECLAFQTSENLERFEGRASQVPRGKYKPKSRATWMTTMSSEGTPRAQSFKRSLASSGYRILRLQCKREWNIRPGNTLAGFWACYRVSGTATRTNLLSYNPGGAESIGLISNTD